MNRVTRIKTIAIISIVVAVAWVAYNVINPLFAKRFKLVDQSTPSLVWSKGVASDVEAEISLQRLAASPKYIYISGSIDRGGQHLNDEGYIAKLDAKNGRLVQFEKYREPGTLDIEFTRIAVDPKTNFLYLLSSSPDAGILVQKIAANGKVVWSKPIDEEFSFVEMHVGPDGNNYVIEKGTFPVSEPYASKNLVYARNSDGKLLWKVEVYRISDVVVDTHGNIYVAGEIMNKEAPYPAILSFSAKGDLRWTKAVHEATDSSKIMLAMDVQKDLVNVIIKTSDNQQDIWQRFSASGKMLNSDQLDFKVDAMLEGSQGRIYCFSKGPSKVTMRGFTRSGKLFFKEKYDRELFAVDDYHELSRSIAISASPDDDGNDAIYTFFGNNPFAENIISRIRVP